MARIKAKPMNRIPVTPIAGGPVPIKNGYRTTPPPPPAVFDPAAAAYAAAAQPRFVYPNGTTMPISATAVPPFRGDQIHMIVSWTDQAKNVFFFEDKAYLIKVCFSTIIEYTVKIL
jgi:hypothetical protein